MDVKETLRAIALALTVLPLAAQPVSGASFTISLDTSPLSGTDILAFGLFDGDGVTNNIVTLTDFDFGGGSATPGTADCTTLGDPGSGCLGDLDTSVTLEDLTPTAFFFQEFGPGSMLSFTLTTTNNFAGSAPDGFAMYLCDNATFASCYSDDANTFAMLVLGLTGGPLSPTSFTLTGAAVQGLDAPVVTALASVPEPSTLILVATGVAGLTLRRRKRHCD